MEHQSFSDALRAMNDDDSHSTRKSSGAFNEPADMSFPDAEFISESSQSSENEDIVSSGVRAYSTQKTAHMRTKAAVDQGESNRRKRGSSVRERYASQDTSSSIAAATRSPRTPRLAASSYWSLPEQAKFWRLVNHFGMDFSSIADYMETKAETMVKNFHSRQVENGAANLESDASAANMRRARDVATGHPPGLAPPRYPRRNADPSSNAPRLGPLDADNRASFVNDKKSERGAVAHMANRPRRPFSIRNASGHTGLYTLIPDGDERWLYRCDILGCGIYVRRKQDWRIHVEEAHYTLSTDKDSDEEPIMSSRGRIVGLETPQVFRNESENGAQDNASDAAQHVAQDNTYKRSQDEPLDRPQDEAEYKARVGKVFHYTISRDDDWWSARSLKVDKFLARDRDAQSLR